ncbi:MAG: GntR family transcriptional regulator [Pirellulaceae bacterium]|nr:MAG: GntR family transcriptional regulator [Pirellulaceae bacterium]
MPDLAPFSSRLSKIDPIVQELAQSIIDQQFSEGSLLPSEGELGRQFGVSRSVIREALQRLAAAGLVETRHGIGTYVNPSNSWNLFDSLLLRAFVESGNLPVISIELAELRSVVEVEAARRAALRVTSRHLRLLQQWLEQMEVGIDDLEIFARADLAYHNVIIEATENRFLIQIMKYLTDPIIEVRRITTRIGGAEGRREAQRWHRAIYEAIERREPQAAAEAMRQHMEQLAEIINQAFLLLAAPGGGVDGSNER